MTHPQRNRILVLSVLLACVLRSGHAHQTQEADGTLLNQLYPGPLGDAHFGKIISGEFTGDLKRDVVVMDGLQPKLCVAPETFDSAIAVGPPANDIATQSGIVAGKDVILTAGPAGLVRFERDSFNATWIITTLRDSNSNWAGAQKVAVGELDDAGAEDIVGIGANGRDVLIEYGNLDGTYTPGTTFSAFGTVATDLWLLNWRDANGVQGTDEIALNSPQGVEIRDPSAAFLEGINWSVAPIIGTVINDKNTEIQRLALVTTDAGVERLFVYGDVKTDGWASLGNPGVVSLAAADVDHDTDTELFMSLNTENNFWWFNNRSPLPATFLAASPNKHHFGPADRNPYLNDADLAPADFDSDGEIDVVAPAQGDHGSPPLIYSSLAFVNVGNPDVAALRPWVNRVAYVTSDPPVIEIRLTRPDEVIQAPAGAQTRLRVKVFHAADVGVGTDVLPYVGYAPMPGPGPGQYSEFSFPVPPGFSLETSTNLFGIVVRQTVVRTSDGAILDILPALTGIYTASPNTPVVQQTPNTLEWMPTIEIPSSNPTFGGLDLGPTVPSMEDDQEPRDHDTP